MSAKNPSDFTVSQLKEKLRELGLLSTGNKAELINRLVEADPSGKWTRGIPEIMQASVTTQVDQSETYVEAPTLASHYERKIEMYRWEKELAERELQFVRRELELAREMQRLNTTGCNQVMERGNT